MGLFGDSNDEPQPVQIVGRTLRCVVCSNDRFWQQRASMHGPVSSFFNLDWAAPSADCAICSACGYVHWFVPLNG